jgi:hypothetical protein
VSSPAGDPLVLSEAAAVGTLPPTAVPADRDAYVDRVDQVCVAVADCLLALRAGTGDA